MKRLPLKAKRRLASVKALPRKRRVPGAPHWKCGSCGKFNYAGHPDDGCIHCGRAPNLEAHFRSECERLQVKGLADSVEFLGQQAMIEVLSRALERLECQLVAIRGLYSASTDRNVRLVGALQKAMSESGVSDLSGKRWVDASKIAEVIQ